MEGALLSPWKLLLPIMLLSPCHSAGVWLWWRTRHVRKIAAQDEIPGMIALPARTGLQSWVVVVGLLAAIAIAGVLTLLAWCRHLDIMSVGPVPVSAAFSVMSATGLPESVARHAVGALLVVLIASFSIGLIGKAFDELAPLDTLIAIGCGLLLTIIFGVMLSVSVIWGDFMAEVNGIAWAWVALSVLHFVCSASAAYRFTTFNRHALRSEFAAWLSRSAADTEKQSAQADHQVRVCQDELSKAEQDMVEQELLLAEERRRWRNLAGREKLEEIKLQSEIEEKAAAITAHQEQAASARIQAVAAQRSAEIQAQASLRATAAAERTAKLAAPRVEPASAFPPPYNYVCRYCGVRNPNMGRTCPYSPTKFHVLLR